MSLTPIERASKALQQSIVNACAQRGGKCNGTPHGLLNVAATLDPREAIRDILEALRVPSMSMVDTVLDAGEEMYHPNGERIEPRMVWAAMIDAALKEG